MTGRKNPIRAVLFDLDGTLLDSSAVKAARDNKDWNTVTSEMGSVHPFPEEPHRFVGQARAKGIAVGIVSSSPAWYVKALLDRFEIPSDTVVTGSDPYQPKPDPAGLQAALAALGVAPDEAAYVGDLATDHQAAASAGMMSIGALWAHAGTPVGPSDWLKWWPDLALSAPAFIPHPNLWPRLGLLAETVSKGETPINHPGDVISHSEGVSLGRYYIRTDRRASHPLSQLILANKKETPNADVIEDSFRLFMRKPSVVASLQGAVVTSVPPAPGQDFDRFAVHRAITAHELSGPDAPGLLRQKYGDEDYKSRRGRADRDVINADRFTATKSIPGDVVVLIDDIATTGSQLGNCKRALMAAGASRVYGLTLAFAQDGLPETCPLCGGYLRLVKGRFGDFWGCNRFWSTGCRYTRDI